MSDNNPGRGGWSASARADLCVFAAGAVSILYPVLLAHARYGAAAPFKFFASDAFYYLNVARRSQGLSFFTYDGTHATNGFHPLWQWLLTSLFSVTHLTEASDQQLLLDYGVCAALAAVGVGLLAMCASQLIGSRVLGLVCVIPGLFELCFSKLLLSTVDSTEAAPWYVVNGMESSLSLFWFGFLVWLLLRRPALALWSPLRLGAISCLFSLTMLSRLDDVFLLVAFAGAVLLLSKDRRSTLQALIAIGTVPALTLFAYLAYNFKTTRFLLPVSASMKRDYGALAANLRNVVETVFPSKLVRAQQIVTWDTLNWRVLQLCLPMLVAAAFILFCLVLQDSPSEAQRRDRRNILAALASYVLLKGTYNLVTVPLLAQGHWYFTLNVASANLLLVYLLGEVLALRGFRPRTGAVSRLILVARGTGVFATVLGLALALASYSRGRLIFALVAVTLPGALLALFAKRAVERASSIGAPTRRTLGTLLGALCVATFIAMYANAVVNQKVNATYGDTNHEFWLARHEIAARLAVAEPTAKLFELDDGVMAYALALPTMSATGLAVDAEAFPACRAQRCIDVAYERGFRVISSVQYWAYFGEQRPGFRRPTAEQEIVDSLTGPGSFDPPPGAERYQFSLVLAANVGNHVIYFLGFKPKS